MIKLSANVSKKVPIPGLEYSSQSFNAGMEVEVASNITRGDLKEKYHELYRILEDSIREQIEAAGDTPQQTAPSQRPQKPERRSGGNGRGGNGRGGNGNGGNGGFKKATEAQARAVFAIARSNGRQMDDVLQPYGVSSPYQLSIGDASTLIDTLKNGG